MQAAISSWFKKYNMLDRESYAEEGAAQALEKALMFTIDAYSHSGLVNDREIIQKLQETLRHLKRRSMSTVVSSEGIEAYVLLNCDLGLEDAVIKELMAIPEVSEVKGVFGVYDFIVKVYTDSEEEIKQAIAKVRAIDKVKSSLTMMVIEAQNGTRPIDR
ncbi:MAG TPA: Lrp/AsnC ligand binding domain-containing protein [Nitrososphaera sp.]|nr:Lrp/AsnC ligand binding domain-containing protein [Nitrososphaera sp.]